MGKRSGCTNKHGVHQPPESLMARRAARAQNHDAEGAAQASSSVLALDPSTGAAFAREGAGQQRSAREIEGRGCFETLRARALAALCGKDLS